MAMKKSWMLPLLAGLLASGATLAGDPVAGQAKSKTCVACHGADGNSAAAEFPRLAGQQADYLVKALKDYKRGSRKNAIMAPQAANLSARDMEDLAAFYSRQQGLTQKY
jgi:cytochrome c553